MSSQIRASRTEKRSLAASRAGQAASERCGVYFMYQKNKQRRFGKGMKNRPYPQD